MLLGSTLLSPTELIKFHVLTWFYNGCSNIKILFSLVDVIILVARSMTFVLFFDSRFSGQDTMLCAEVVELYFKLYGRKNPVLTMSAAVTAAASAAATAVSQNCSAPSIQLIGPYTLHKILQRFF